MQFGFGNRHGLWWQSIGSGNIVQDEMRQGLSYFHETIFSSLPVFQRRIDTALKNIGQPMLPLEHNLFHFGSWMGGDRDGNPFVTPETTREVVITARLSAVNLYFQQTEMLMFDLSTWRCNADLQVNSWLSLTHPCHSCTCTLVSNYITFFLITVCQASDALLNDMLPGACGTAGIASDPHVFTCLSGAVCM